MSGLINLTPFMQIIIENPFARKIYPIDGTVSSVIDTGYQGFVSVPNSVFQDLALNKMRAERRRIALADGTILISKGCYATIQVPSLSVRMDGFVETFPGTEEILVGTEALSRTKILLDYCARKVKVEACSSTKNV